MSEQPPRPEWVRYRLAKDEIVLTFRVPKGTPMVMEQAGWDVEGAVIEAEAGATAAVPLDYPTLTAAIRRLYTRGNYLGHRAEDDAQAILQEVARLSADEEDPDPTGILDSEPGSF